MNCQFAIDSDSFRLNDPLEFQAPQVIDKK
jgi:hypothetical protein